MPSTPASTDGAPRHAAEVLRLTDLGVRFQTPRGAVEAVREVTLSVAAGECLGVVGESGAGKSQLFLAALGLLAANGRASGSARFRGQELLGLAPAALDAVRGAGIGLVFQDPMTSLTPHLTVGAQLIEVIVRHRQVTPEAAQRRALALLERVQLTDPARRLRQHPHELSGGMRQRVMIAIALGCDPQLLIADEPTTALDVTVQAQILALLQDLKRERALAMVLITHDVGVVAGLADRVAVMQAGRVVETGPVAAVLSSPREPYTRELLRRPEAGPSRPQWRAIPGAEPALRVDELGVEFAVGRGWLERRRRLAALSGVTFEVAHGEALGVVGESGGGKSTLARAVLALLRPSRGHVAWNGREVTQLHPRQLRAQREHVQMVFQDVVGSLDPRMTVREIVAESLRVYRPLIDSATRAGAIARTLARVGLDTALLDRYPHELSGGQCQRVGIARAMVLEPRILLCDEPLSGLDGPTQQQIVSVLAALRQNPGMTLLFVSHNLALVSQLCDRVLVLYLGRMMEITRPERLGGRARHPYTRELLAAVPVADPQVQPARLQSTRAGEPPSPLDPPSGCVYRTRCPYAIALCAERTPAWEETGNGEERVACHRWRELN
jgi:peptide/nickel transport system ATP-binding protein